MIEKDERNWLESQGYAVFDDGCDAIGLSEAEKAVVDARNESRAERNARRKARGWKFGDYGDFLGMTPEEKAVVERRFERKRRGTVRAGMDANVGPKRPHPIPPPRPPKP